MKRHQVLTGAVNAGDHCFSVGSVEGIHFTAYAAGCDVVILASDFQRVQIIPGVTHGNIQVGCIDCSLDTGKIAAAYGKNVCIFEPTPLLHHNSSHKLDYQWVQTGTITTDSYIYNLSWNQEGTRLLLSCNNIQMWYYSQPLSGGNEEVSFHLGDPDLELDSEIKPNWELIWQCTTATPAYHLKFSPDGTSFASAGKADRLVKIWYENKKVQFFSKSDSITTSNSQDTRYSFIYIAHPRAVTGFSWRQTSKYMPKGAIANMLITSCKDNICRIWCETILPDDGLVNLQQFDPVAAQNPKFHTQRHKHKFIQRLKHLRLNFHRHRKNQQSQDYPESPIPTLPSTNSIHDFHKFTVHGSTVSPGFHYHLAASINAETDIPLVPPLHSNEDGDHESFFVMHWLNNKEMHFTMVAEQLLEEVSRKAFLAEQQWVEDHEKLESLSSENVDSEEPEEELSKDDAGDASTTHYVKHKALGKKRKFVKRISRKLSKQKLSEEVSDESLSSLNRYRQAPSYGSSMSITSHSEGSGQSGSQQVHHAQNENTSLEHKIEELIRNWNHSSDLLFSIHPLDGSFLVWLVDWLDEYIPSSFRQAQVSFSSRIPHALPLGDAMSMSSHLSLYCVHSTLNFKGVLRLAERQSMEQLDKTDTLDEVKPNEPSINPCVCMLSKHSNGTLNLWQVSFGENSNFSTVLNVAHDSRVCGHRFRTNDIACHPVLPLLLTTSHHNHPIPPESGSTSEEESSSSPPTSPLHEGAVSPHGFCSELILWKVEPVGPLSKSGGVYELARINSPEISAFSSVAWLPTLLPSFTLGNISNSPSACFVASDGCRLRIYQAVIDARTLLAEVNTAERRCRMKQDRSFSSSSSLDGMSEQVHDIRKLFKIVSEQSTAGPGCVIELSAISDAQHDWQNTQLLHIFQEQMITGEKSTDYDLKGDISMGAMVDLRYITEFEEHFYLVVLEKSEEETMLHMWEIILASQPHSPQAYTKEEPFSYTPDTNLVQDSDDSAPSSRSNTPEPASASVFHSSSQLSITTVKVCTQALKLPFAVFVVHAVPAAGHLSSSSIYPACFAPYLIATACSDGSVRFWKCQVTVKVNDSSVNTISHRLYEWTEWEMMDGKNSSSIIQIPGRPLSVSCAYNGRIACAYKSGDPHRKISIDNPETKFVNLCVGIYECESTGGSEWILEDVIELHNITLSSNQPEVDLSYLFEKGKMAKTRKSVEDFNRLLSTENGNTVELTQPNIHLISVPSFSTLYSLKKSISEKGNQCILTQKHIVLLDWVSTEDGSHVLTVGVGAKIFMYGAVSSCIVQASGKVVKDSSPGNWLLMKKTPSMAQSYCLGMEDIRWMKLRNIELQSADGLPPLAMQMSWVRDGILMIGLENELHVYSQWKASESDFQEPKRSDDSETSDRRNLTDQDLFAYGKSSSIPVPALSRDPSHFKLTDLKKKKDSIKKSIKSESQTSLNGNLDLGLFEIAKMASPVLPQYHPKQLMELLNFGKVHRVKAILAHLVRCIASSDNSVSTGGNDDNWGRAKWSRSRTLSIAGPSPEPVTMLEEVQLDYAELTSIPPLPIFALLAADKDISNLPDSPFNKKDDSHQDYSSLFNAEVESETLDITFDEGPRSPRDRRRSIIMEKRNLDYFGPRQARKLTRLLTHQHLPGLSSLDQMHLLALADTVASCNTDFADKFSHEASKSDALDDCGLRYLLAMKHHICLQRSLPLHQRAHLQHQGLSYANIAWAFHSESEEELLSAIPCMQRGNPKWSELKELGVAWWVRNGTILKTCMEKVAKAAFQAHNDPLDAALFYLAMKKKNILWGLFRSVKDDRMKCFFQNDFSESRWRKAALKNAFALLSKQRFEHATAFFLLGGSLKDAIKVCLNQLQDIQLAMVLIRMYESDSKSEVFNQLLFQEILGCDLDGSNYKVSKAHPDPFLRSMTYWLLKDYSSALSTLLQTNIGREHPQYCEEKNGDDYSANPSVFNFYNYLRTHPLIVRQHLTLAQDKNKAMLITIPGDKEGTVTDKITAKERRLFFTTSQAHFRSGSPLLALEVLTKLPNVIHYVEEDNETSPGEALTTLKAIESKSENITWGQPFSRNLSNGPDSSQPLTGYSDHVFDWSQPVSCQLPEEPLDLKFSDSESDGEDKEQPKISESIQDISKSPPKLVNGLLHSESLHDNHKSKLDIMAQQVKFIACLKIIMEELSTLATGFEVDGGQLRYQLYIWLEQEIESLRILCNYGSDFHKEPEIIGTDANEPKSNLGRATPVKELAERPTLHEVILADKMDFEAKLQRLAQRKRWLKANQQLLRTLLSYCSLHGGSCVGLASLRMELKLLLQELQQEKTQQQLLSPLPFPTTLPLLSASVASHKTVIADPIHHLQCLTRDVLQTIVEFNTPPLHSDAFTKVLLMRDLSISLSACIYQSLCDSDSFNVSQPSSIKVGMEVFTSAITYRNSRLVGGYKHRRHASGEEELKPSSSPAKWPGVQTLRALLAHERDEDSPKLHVLLCEAFVAVYMSLLLHGLATYDANLLFRIIAHKYVAETWSMLFGGGIKKLLKIAVTPTPTLQRQQSVNKATELLINKRTLLHMKILGHTKTTTEIKEDRRTYREQFLPPEISMFNWFMSKPPLEESDFKIDYNSDESDEDSELNEDDDDVFSKKVISERAINEHCDPNSYSWCLLRFAIVKLAKHNLQTFLGIAGLELSELPVCSPLIHSVLKTLNQWQQILNEKMDSFQGPPENYLPNIYVEQHTGGPFIYKYKCILEPSNTPFMSPKQATLPVKRLWLTLVHKEMLQDIFVRYIFKKKLRPEPSSPETLENSQPQQQVLRLIHKEQEIITAFCINQANNSVIALATPKEVQEMDISNLLYPPVWIEDECEYDIHNLKNVTPVNEPDDFIVIQTSADRPPLSVSSSTHSMTCIFSTNAPQQAVGGGHGTLVVKGLNIPGLNNLQYNHYIVERSHHMIKLMRKRPVNGARRMASHPFLPYYLTGTQDGGVKLWEWNHSLVLATLRSGGGYAKITRVHFNPQGNKFGASDADGTVCLWQLGLSSITNKPFLSFQCHNKSTSDFTFVGSSSLIATAGHSSESKNVCLWDTLLPQRKSLVQAFTCHDQGSPVIMYLPQHQCLMSGGKKGDICIFDVRQRVLRHKFVAHETAVKCLALDPTEGFFVSGSADGDIKIWSLENHGMIGSFPGEHTRSTFFRNIGVGVMQLHVDREYRLYSCGADGSMKVRHLQEKDITAACHL